MDNLKELVESYNSELVDDQAPSYRFSTLTFNAARQASFEELLNEAAEEISMSGNH